MKNSTRNLMVLYGIVAFISIAGVAMNISPIFSLRSLEDPKITENTIQLLTKGFYTTAIFYLIIALTSLGTMIRKKYSKTLLIVLVILLISVFVFGPFMFDYILADSELDVNVKR